MESECSVAFRDGKIGIVGEHCVACPAIETGTSSSSSPSSSSSSWGPSIPGGAPPPSTQSDDELWNELFPSSMQKHKKANSLRKQRQELAESSEKVSSPKINEEPPKKVEPPEKPADPDPKEDIIGEPQGRH